MNTANTESRLAHNNGYCRQTHSMFTEKIMFLKTDVSQR